MNKDLLKIFIPSLFFLIVFILSLTILIVGLEHIQFFEWVIVIAILIALYSSIKFNQGLAFITSPFLILHFWAIFSVFYIESGAYVIEQDAYGHKNGSGILLTSMMSLFSSILFFPDIGEIKMQRFFKKPTLNKVNPIYISSFILLVLSILILFYGIIYSGSIPLLNSNRFAYFDEAPRIVKIVYLSSGLVSFIAGVSFAESRNRIINILVILLIIMIILSGDKFTGIFLAVINFIAGFSIRSEIRLTRKQLITIAGFFFLFVTVIVSVGFLFMHDIGDKDLFEVIIERALALQGHVFYGTYELSLTGGLESLSLEQFFKPSTSENPMGIDFLMYQVSDNNFASAMLSQGITFTMGYPAILFVFFDNLLYIYMAIIVSAIFFRFFALGIIKYTIRGNIILMILNYLIFFIFIDYF